MLFSVIIPTYNRATILPETLRSVQAQTFRDFEVLVIDDGSTDTTGEMVKKLADPLISYHYKKNEERAIARNYGADLATGDYLIFLDSDDRMAPAHLNRIAEFISNNKQKPDFIFTGYRILNSDGSAHYSFSKDGIFDKKNLAHGNYLGCSGVVISRTVFKKYYFNTLPDLIMFEDWQLWLRVIAEHPLYCLPAESIHMINHAGRSVLSCGAEQLIGKIHCLKKEVLNSVPFVSESSWLRRSFVSGIYSYAALHIALSGKRRDIVVKYLAKTLAVNPFFIFRRRFAAILKHLF